MRINVASSLRFFGWTLRNRLLIKLPFPKPTIAAALSAGLTAIATYHLPYKLNLMAAALVGIAVGLILEQQSPIVNPQSPIPNRKSPITTHDHE